MSFDWGTLLQLSHRTTCFNFWNKTIRSHLNSRIESEYLYFWQVWKVWWTKETPRKVKTFLRHITHHTMLESWLIKPQILAESGEAYVYNKILYRLYILCTKILHIAWDYSISGRSKNNFDGFELFLIW